MNNLRLYLIILLTSHSCTIIALIYFIINLKYFNSDIQREFIYIESPDNNTETIRIIEIESSLHKFMRITCYTLLIGMVFFLLGAYWIQTGKPPTPPVNTT